MVSTNNPSNNATAVTPARDQDQDNQEVQSHHNIESLLQKLRQIEARNEALLSEKDKNNALLAEKDALLAEKDAQLSVALANNNIAFIHSLAPIIEDGSAGDETNHFGSVSTYDDYLASQKLKARWHNSVLSSISCATNATVRTAEEMRVIRRIDRRDAARWEALEAECETVAGEDHGHGSRTPWYNPPIQRQRWCENQSLPHVNWGDIFFDLFYVGAAFNLGALIKTAAHEQGDQLLRGFIYFFGSLGPLWTCWEVQTFYRSRYVTNDYFHRLVDIVRYFCVGIAIYSITPLHYFSNKYSDDVLEFTLAMFVELMIAMGLCLELYFKGLGDRESIQNHTLDDFKFRNMHLFVLYLAAFIIAAVIYAQARQEGSGDHVVASDEYGTEYWVSDASDAHGNVAAGHDTADSHAVVESHVVEEAHHEATTDTGDHGMGESGGHEHRLLNSSSSHGEGVFVGRGIWDIYDLPMTLTTVAYFLRFFMTSIRRVCHVDDRRGCSVSSYYRDCRNKDYFVTIVCGLLTMIFIFVLKTESEPHDSSQHAMWRGHSGALWYSVFVQTLTIGLIGFGVCYKSFLHDIFDHTLLTGRDWQAQEIMPDHFFIIAKAFSAFLTIVVLSLELMNLTHRDMKIKTVIGLFFQNSNEGSKRLNWPVVIVFLLKVGVILFCATLFVWLTLPDELAIAGLSVVFALSVTRVLNHIFINEKEMVEEMTERAVDVAGNLVRGATKRFNSLKDEKESTSAKEEGGKR